MQTRLPRRLVLAAASVPLAVGYAPPASAAPAPARYVVTDLGALGTGDFSVATAINNAGVVVGYSNVTPVLVHAFRWADGTLTDLGALPGDGNTSRATAVNDAGQVAGVSSRASGGFGYTVRWTGGVIQDFGSPNTFQLSFGTGIDPAGRVVGAQRPPDSRDLHPVRWSAAGAATDLGLPAGAAQAQANGVNVRGQIVGSPAFVWRSGAFTLLPPLPGANGATATAINVGGVVVGSSPAVTTNTVHAVRWRGLAVTDLGTVDGIAFSTATAINAAGQIVGTADPQCVPCPAPRAWLWDTGTITPLDSLIPAGSGWALQQANGINDRGQIVGAGLHNGQPHAYLLTPRFSATVNFQPAGAAVPVGYRCGLRPARVRAVLRLERRQPGERARPQRGRIPRPAVRHPEPHAEAGRRDPVGPRGAQRPVHRPCGRRRSGGTGQHVPDQRRGPPGGLRYADRHGALARRDGQRDRHRRPAHRRQRGRRGQQQAQLHRRDLGVRHGPVAATAVVDILVVALGIPVAAAVAAWVALRRLRGTARRAAPGGRAGERRTAAGRRRGSQRGRVPRRPPVPHLADAVHGAATRRRVLRRGAGRAGRLARDHRVHVPAAAADRRTVDRAQRLSVRRARAGPDPGVATGRTPGWPASR